jgi:hypothetical protein
VRAPFDVRSQPVEHAASRHVKPTSTNLIRSSSIVVDIMYTSSADDRTPTSSSSAAPDPSHPPSVNAPTTRASNKRQREETTEESHEENESPATSVEQSQQLQPSSLEEKQSDPAAAVHPTSAVEDAATVAAGVVHIDKRARIDDGPHQQARSGDEIMESPPTSDVAPPVTAASSSSSASSSIPSLASTFCPAPLTSAQIRACIQCAGFDVIHNDATPNVRKLLSQLLTCAWNYAGLEPRERDELPLIRDLIQRIDVRLEQMARRQSSPYPAKVQSLVSHQQQLSVNVAVSTILVSVHLTPFELVCHETMRDRRMVSACRVEAALPHSLAH